MYGFKWMDKALEVLLLILMTLGIVTVATGLVLMWRSM